MNRFLLLSTALLSAVALLSACVTLEPMETGSEPISADAMNAMGAVGPPLDVFFASGRLSLRQGDRRDFLKFDWHHAPGRDSLLLLSPLGQGVAELVRDSSGARLMRAGEIPVVAPDIDTLILQILGTAVPLDELGHWLSGRRGISGNAAGWRISVVQTTSHPVVAQGRLPRRLEAIRDDVALTLIVDEWAAGENLTIDKKNQGIQP